MWDAFIWLTPMNKGSILGIYQKRDISSSDEKISAAY
jgi:hypothetical protein